MLCKPEGRYSVSDVAKKLGCTEENVYRLIKSDGLNFKLPRGHSRNGLYINKEDYEKWEQEKWS